MRPADTLMDALENDLARLRRAFNERILYVIMACILAKSTLTS